MTCYYAFNGDADGLCALQQLRLVEAQQATLVTGVKRDIALLRRIQGQAGDAVTVLDVSLHQNREDLHCHPAELAELMRPFRDPVSFIEQTGTYAKLHACYEEDMAKARGVASRCGHEAGIIVLPNEPWARRAIGVLTNELMQSRPNTALAILSPKASGGFTVSVRVPADNPVSAAEFCGGFETGGGRRSAGGINYLAEADLDRCAARFEARFGTR